MKKSIFICFILLLGGSLFRIQDVKGQSKNLISAGVSLGFRNGNYVGSSNPLRYALDINYQRQIHPKYLLGIGSDLMYQKDKFHLYSLYISVLRTDFILKDVLSVEYGLQPYLFHRKSYGSLPSGDIRAERDNHIGLRASIGLKYSFARKYFIVIEANPAAISLGNYNYTYYGRSIGGVYEESYSRTYFHIFGSSLKIFTLRFGIKI